MLACTLFLSEAAEGTAATLIAGVGDLQRVVARLAASAGDGAEGTPRVVYYEDTAKRKVLALVAALRSLEALQARPIPVPVPCVSPALLPLVSSCRAPLRGRAPSMGACRSCSGLQATQTEARASAACV